MRGPFRSLRHEHGFIPTATGCALVDVVEFTPPFGPLVSIAERLVLGRYLRRLIDIRNAEFLADSTSR